MSIQTELDRIKGLVEDSHEKVKAKGGATAKPYLLANLPGAIESIPEGAELPELSELAEPEEVFSGKEYIDDEGRKKTGSFTIDEELTEQELLIAQIANALQGKAIGSLASLPPLENRAEPGDIVSGKTLYDDNGKIVIGTMKSVESEEIEPLDDGSGNVKFSHMATYNRYVPAWNLLTITSPLDKFGDAFPNDVRKGKTFTSTSGVKIEGTMETENGVELPKLDNRAYPEDMAMGKQLIDENGNVVEGTLVDDGVLQISDNVLVETDDGTIEMVAPVTEDCVLRVGDFSRLIANSSAFGNASPNDVRKGKTFTSTSGVRVEGTMEAADEMEVESLSEIHYWTKNFAGNPYEEVYIRNGIYLGNIGSTIQYADDIAISGGSVVLVNPKEYTITSKTSDADAVLLGKYVKAVTGIYRIPTDAPITYAAATQWTSAHLNASFGYKINAVQGAINTIVISKDIAAYPENGEQDGFTYIYQGTIPWDTDGASVSVDGETLVFEGTSTIENDTLIL